MTPSRDDILRMAREAGMAPHLGHTDDDGKHHPAVNALKTSVPVEWLERFAALVAAHAWALKPPPAMVVKTADLDPALLRDMLANAPPMQLLPMPPDAALASERAARIAAQTEVAELKERLARSGVEERRAVAAEREACAALMASLRAKSRNHLFRSALTIAEGEIRARSKL